MGLAASVEDKRSLRLQHRVDFQREIKQQKKRREKRENEKVSDDRDKQGIRVFVRVRPLFPHERKNGEFIVVEKLDSRTVLVHDCRMKANLQDISVDTIEFETDGVFGPNDDEDGIYVRTVRPLVEHSFLGGMSTNFMFGQTGSGKTHTMRATIARTSCDIFELKNKLGSPISVRVSCFEIAGSRCRDLLDKNTKVRLLEDENGCVHVHDVTVRQPMNAKELYASLLQAVDARATAETGVHDKSSRSHAIFGVTIENSREETIGCLLLVDLAGSEWNRDSRKHDQKRREESAEINKSLMALKHCMAAFSQRKTRVPFRESKLTQVLKASFSHHDAMLAIISTVSPCSSDSEHTLATLKGTCTLHQGT